MHDVRVSVFRLITDHQYSKVGKMVAGTCDGSILTNIGLAASISPISKVKVPRYTLL